MATRLKRYASGRGPWVVGTVLAVFIVIYLAWYNWCWLSGDDSPGATIRNLVLALAALVALPLALWRSYTAHKQADAAQNQAAAAQEQLALAELDSLGSRYQKGAEMLGSEKISSRIGGVHTLKRLAENHPEEFHIQVMELLCAFVRDPPESEKPQEPRGQDLTAALNAIIHRSDAGIALEEASRSIASRDGPSAKIVDDEGFRVNLSGANLMEANLDRAKLQGAFLTDVNMSGVYVSNADFTGAIMSRCEITSTPVFKGTIFDKAEMIEAKISEAYFQDCSFVDAWMSSDLSESHLENTNLTGAKFTAVNLKNTVLANVDLSDAKFRQGIRMIQNPDTGNQVPQSGFCEVTQHQLDSAMANPDKPPHFQGGTVDIETGKSIVWNHKLCGDRWLEYQKSRGSKEH